MKKLKLLSLALLSCLMLFLAVPLTFAASAGEINAGADHALSTLYKTVRGSHNVVDRAKGVLVMPNVYRAGFGVGGEYGQGVLRMGSKPVDYYNLVSASYGLQIGAQKQSIILVFMTDSALRNFQNSSGWRVGADAEVTVVKTGADGSIESNTLNKPVIAFVVGQKGLMAGVSIEGAKFNKINKK